MYNHRIVQDSRASFHGEITLNESTVRRQSRRQERLGTPTGEPEKPSIPALNRVIAGVNIRLPGCIVLRSSWGKVLIRLPFRVVGLDISESPRRSIVLGPRVALSSPFLLLSSPLALPSTPLPLSPASFRPSPLLAVSL